MDYLTKNWGIVVSALSGILLLAVVSALIFNRGFRKDLAAARGKASILGLLSVEGVVVVILCCIFFIGLIYPVYRGDSSGEARASADPPPAVVQGDEDLPRRIAALSPENPISSAIKAIADAGKGPWSPYSESREIRISVPGNLPPQRVLSCPEWQGKTLELISNYRMQEKILRGDSSIKVKVNGLIFAATNCRDIAGYDIKLNCADARSLFSDDVLECDASNNPQWKVNDRLLPAYAAVIVQ